MTNGELAELRGELFGLRILLCNLLAFQAGNTSDPVRHLAALKEQSLAGIPEATNAMVPQYMDQFRAAAAGVVLQAAEAASAGFPQGKPRPKLPMTNCPGSPIFMG